MDPRRFQKGFTLVELLTATAIFAIAIAAATGVFLAQNAAYLRESGVRESQQGARTAIEVLSRAVRMAGYGIDPQLAFDFDFYNCAMGTVAGTGSQRGECAALRRDSATRADELVVHSRNPYYTTASTVASGCAQSSTLVGNVWRVIAATGGGTPSVTLEMRADTKIRQGQVLQIICQDAATYTYVTASAAANSAGGTCNNVQVALATPVSITGLAGTLQSPFTRSDLLTAACFGAGTARAFLVDRQRFYIHQDTTSETPRPYLMLDRGIDTAGPNGGAADGVLDDNDLIPIVADVEDLQISYVLEQVGINQTTSAMTASTSTYMIDGNANGIWGDLAGTAEQLTFLTAATTPNLAAALTAANTAAGLTSAGAPCFNVTLAPYRHPCTLDKGTLELAGAAAHPYRWLPWPGNITHVRIGVSARASTPVAVTGGLTSTDVTRLTALENRNAVDLKTTTGFYAAMNPTHYQRTMLLGAVRTVNLASSGMFTF